jgi:hypothetical protein
VNISRWLISNPRTQGSSKACSQGDDRTPPLLHRAEYRLVAPFECIHHANRATRIRIGEKKVVQNAITRWE